MQKGGPFMNLYTHVELFGSLLEVKVKFTLITNSKLYTKTLPKTLANDTSIEK